MISDLESVPRLLMAMVPNGPTYVLHTREPQALFHVVDGKRGQTIFLCDEMEYHAKATRQGKDPISLIVALQRDVDQYLETWESD